MGHWMKEHPERAKEINTKSRKKHLVKRAAYQREYSAKHRAAMIELFGGACERCGFDDPRALQMDHIEGGGTAAIRRIGPAQHQLNLWRNANPLEYQLLCANCNWIKRYEKEECRRTVLS